MYSRNRRDVYDSIENDNENETLSDDEYELYRYNLPPRYDGNRFRKRPAKAQHVRSSPPEPANTLSNTSKLIPKDSECDRHPPQKNPSTIFSRLGNSLGYEEILIISLILLISDSDQASGDVILFLALLLLVRQK